MEALHSPPRNRIPWNKGELTGQKPPFDARLRQPDRVRKDAKSLGRCPQDQQQPKPQNGGFPNSILSEHTEYLRVYTFPLTDT